MNTQEHLQKILDDHSKIKMELESKRKLAEKQSVSNLFPLLLEKYNFTVAYCWNVGCIVLALNVFGKL